ncbi:MAG: glutamine amidotransferase [Gammaproteobacteria bacterium]|nr:glutamine amidotransferase [Gammaproteobacteria bacterium]
MSKPFLVLQLRPEEATAASELGKICHYGGLAAAEVHRVRLDQEPAPELALADYSAIIVGGSPFDLSAPAAGKSNLQVAIEAFFQRLLDEVVDKDFPFLGCCSGNGLLGRHLGAGVSKRFGEDVGGVDIEITAAGREDPLLAGMPAVIRVLVGHKEACDETPPGSTLLAKGGICPVQMFRVGANVYATQFHPEGDFEGFSVRIGAYKHHGYFPPAAAAELTDRIRAEHTPEAHEILRRFVARYRTETTRRGG